MKIITCLFLFFLSLQVSGQKEENIINEFENTLKLIEKNEFKIVLHIATPLNEMNIRIDSAWIIVRGDTASGYLPYYSGGKFSFPMEDRKGINFNNTMIDQSMRIKGRNAKKAIKYQFDVVGTIDTYKIEADIQYDRTCYIYINSLRRSPISYIGTLYKVDEK